MNEAEGSFRDLRERLDSLGFRPSKKLGQNFLVDRNLLRAIAGELDLEGQAVLEIGAGPGGLTRELAQWARKVLAVEVDERLQEFLAEEILSWGKGKVRLLESSALEGTGLHPHLERALQEEHMEALGYVCVSNLPYSISGPMLASLCLGARPPREILCLCQWEMGERILSEPGGRDYGSLSALLGLAWKKRLVRRVGREVFRPRPGVDSALIHLGPLEEGLLSEEPSLRQEFGKFLLGLFAARRKQLRSGLTRWLGRSPVPLLESAGLDESVLTRRPETFLPEELWEIFRVTKLDSEGRDL